LVVEASRQAGSLAALVRGFRDHQPELHIAGVVLNGVGSERHHALLAEALASIAMPLLGALPRHDSLELPSRHLGLLPAHELGDLQQRLGAWADLAERHLDLEQLWPLLEAPQWSPASLQPAAWPPSTASSPVPVAIASDAAFHFRYPEAAELLEAQGLTVLPWSPLADEALPPGSRALILPGGYPELHAAALASSCRSLAALPPRGYRSTPSAAACCCWARAWRMPTGWRTPWRGCCRSMPAAAASASAIAMPSPTTTAWYCAVASGSAAMNSTAGS
jgi:cobyrinic acid a,c-diamide synthase